MAAHTVGMARVASLPAFHRSPLFFIASLQACQRSIFGLPLKSSRGYGACKIGPALKLSRCGLYSLYSCLRTPHLIAVRCVSNSFRPIAGQWRPVEEEEVDGGVQGGHLEAENAEWPRPPVVSFNKEISNTVHLIGRVGRDMEIKYFDTGKVLAKSSLAVPKTTLTTVSPSAPEVPPSWLELEIWDTLAESAGHHVKKGDKIYVTGRLVVDSYINKNDIPQKSTKIVVRTLSFVESENSVKYPKNSSEPEQLWNEYFANPSQWWDNRGKKVNPRGPDFKHKTTNEALWIDSFKKPAWVDAQLEKLDSRRPQPGGGFSGRSQPNSPSSFTDGDLPDF